MPNDNRRAALIRDFSEELIKAYREKDVYHIPAGPDAPVGEQDLGALYRAAYEIARERLTRFEQEAFAEFWAACVAPPSAE